jgi:hypothetical protein
MLHKVKSLKGYKLHGIDADIGKIDEFYFDDKYWTIRYLVADTGNWLTGTQVLISPFALLKINVEAQSVSIGLTKKQIEESPSLYSDQPVSRQYEASYYEYFGWNAYWEGGNVWGPYISPENSVLMKKEAIRREKTWDPHLYSTRDASKHAIQCTDGEIGHLEDFILDDMSWTIRYLIIDTRNLWPGKKILLSPEWIKSISWNESKVYVDQLRETIRAAPEYTDEMTLTRAYEEDLHRYYNSRGYWADEPK